MGKYAEEIKLQMEDAATNLQSARELVGQRKYDVAASHAYRSAFHAASALLLDEEIERGRHGDAITLIQQIFVNGRRLTKEQGGKLSWLFELGQAEERQDVRPAGLETAEEAIQIAESFLEAAKVLLEA